MSLNEGVIPFLFQSSNNSVGCIPCTNGNGAWNAPYDISLLTGKWNEQETFAAVWLPSHAGKDEGCPALNVDGTKTIRVCCKYAAALIFLFDRRDWLCQTGHMFSHVKKIVAVLLAIWLPMFSGNALAVSVAMHTMSGDCPMVAPHGEHRLQQASAAYQHTQHAQLAGNQDQSAGNCDQQNSHQYQQNSAHNNCGVCHFACCGHLAAVSITVDGGQPSAQLFTVFSAQFQSTTLTPLDQPPLARV